MMGPFGDHWAQAISRVTKDHRDDEARLVPRILGSWPRAAVGRRELYFFLLPAARARDTYRHWYQACAEIEVFRSRKPALAGTAVG
jgi:hypothetical protein